MHNRPPAHPPSRPTRLPTDPPTLPQTPPPTHTCQAILARKLVLPEVYDLMGRVQELMVQSQAASVRALASAALLQFLLDYPLGECWCCRAPSSLAPMRVWWACVTREASKPLQPLPPAAPPMRIRALLARLPAAPVTPHTSTIPRRRQAPAPAPPVLAYQHGL